MPEDEKQVKSTDETQVIPIPLPVVKEYADGGKLYDMGNSMWMGELPPQPKEAE